MRTIVRWISALALIALLLFCLVGLLATTEPLPESTQSLWRWIYGLLAAACVAGLIGLFRSRTRS
jgi:hypothetical protein